MAAERKVPNKLFFKIGEVCEITDTQPYVLRYWESEFSALAPAKNSSGQRIYRRRDIETVLRIKQLLYEEGFTIAGAKKRLEAELAGRVDTPQEPTAAPAAPTPPPSATPNPGTDDAAALRAREALLTVRDQLREMLTLLNRDDTKR
jgi:DNA-binding transcriptional MerR regulator